MSLFLFTRKDFFRSVVLGILVGWLLIAIHDPKHKRFDFQITLTTPSEQIIA